MIKPSLKMFGAILTILFTTSVFAQQTSVDKTGATLDAKSRQTVIDEISKALNENYVYAETAQKMAERITTQLKNGSYDSSASPDDFSAAIFKDLREVSKDKHLSFHYDPEGAADVRHFESQNKEDVEKIKEKQLASLRKDNFGFKKVERLDGNIGYLRFDSFAFAKGAEEAASSAMNFLSNCDALIIDLRQNGGGHPAQIQYITSYLFDTPVHLNDIYTRKDDSTENYWTLPYVPGKRMPNADVYVLTSGYTFSGAEEFAYNLKNLKRATIIVEITGGGAHPVNAVVIADKYVLYVPYARAINPITKSNWEGTGVSPDVTVKADQAYDTAYRLAIEKLLAKTDISPTQKAELQWVQVSLKSRTESVNLNDSTMQMYAGTYQDRKIFVENGTLYYQRSGPRYKMIPLSETLFEMEGLPDFRLQFVVENGKTVEVIGLYRAGNKEPSRRTG
jgi:hypothetical protein